MSESSEHAEEAVDEELQREDDDPLAAAAAEYAAGDLSAEGFQRQLFILMATLPEQLPQIQAFLAELRANAAAASSVTHAKPSGDKPPLGVSLGGPLSAEYRRARRLTSSTLHLTSESASHTIRYDPVLGAQLADLPATKPIKSEQVFNYVLAVFRHNALDKSLLSATDAHELCIFVAERLYTRSRVDALECTVRRLLYDVDAADGAIALADLVCTRGENVLTSEISRFTALSPITPTAPRFRPDRPSADPAPRERENRFCLNWALGRPCSDRTKVNGVCRFETEGKHICGKPLGDGAICQEHHRRSEHQ